ncbi:hypothetical protein PR048_027706 [Dryococelus australis]|uniref:Uncharacterized protein n=1 Tax=Dryococelus australis TaxID=614101 RepID=A0ABQ9GHA4_9NEOP|nr:hypothetical protein PR048_027706 [Dryococelus australis]
MAANCPLPHPPPSIALSTVQYRRRSEDTSRGDIDARRRLSLGRRSAGPDSYPGRYHPRQETSSHHHMSTTRHQEDPEELRSIRSEPVLELAAVVFVLFDYEGNIMAAQSQQAGRRGGGESYGGGNGDTRDNPPTNGIVLHDSHMLKSRVTRPGIEPGSPWWEASRLTAQPQRPPARRKSPEKARVRRRETVYWSNYSLAREQQPGTKGGGVWEERGRRAGVGRTAQIIRREEGREDIKKD